MRPFLRPLVVVLAVLFAAGCSSGGDDASSTTTVGAGTSAAPETTAAVTTTEPPGGASTPTLAADDPARQEALDLIDELTGGHELAPGERDCLLAAVAGDDDVRQALADGTDFTALPAEVRQRAVTLAIGCAPRTIAEMAVDAVDLDIDEEASTCLRDQIAASPDLLAAMGAVVASGDPSLGPDDVPAGAILDLLGLLGTCHIPLSALG
jgi:hypothetical protein